jgi:hypothetical protein
MRIATALAVALLAAPTVAPAKASAQVNVDIAFGARVGPEVAVFAYSPERHGAWRRTYREWTPVTLYDVNGRYFRTQVRGSRPVLLYSYHNEIFLPPREKAWIGFDKRYDYKSQPVEVDYGRVRPFTPEVVAINSRAEFEIGVMGYSPERAGPWRANYRRWTPVTLYELNGRYYSRTYPGARPVAMYRFQDEYFLPPNDEKWVGVDKRFDYGHRPNKDDWARVRIRF